MVVEFQTSCVIHTITNHIFWSKMFYSNISFDKTPVENYLETNLDEGKTPGLVVNTEDS